MFLFQYDKFGSVYKLDSETQELLVTPMYADNSINLDDWSEVEWRGVEIECIEELCEIHKYLIQLSSNVYSFNSDSYKLNTSVSN